MRIRLLATAIIALFLASASSAQTAPDQFDTVLVTYQLSAAQETQFDGHDGALAAFWSEWDTQNASSLNRDYILMDPAHCAQPGRDYYTGPEDNSVYIRAAYGQNGIYMLVEMVDNDFLDRNMGTNTDSIHRDVFELYIDTLSSEENRTLGALCYIGLYDATLTYTSVQLLLSLGRNRVYDNFRISFYDEFLWSWQDSWTRFTTAETDYDGMLFESVTVSPTRRAQEWFLPWSWVGQGGPASPVPPQGRRFAFAGGCHDMDSAQGDTVCSLKWKNRGNPWAAKVGDEYNNTWGDLELGPSLTTTKVPGTTTALRPPRGMPGRGEVYTIDGRKVCRTARPWKGSAVVVVLMSGEGQARIRPVHGQ